ncbi:MAG: DUF1819 family protein [Desulfobacteraceae bacterium]|nr:DUF1819 family protein [Desulfobacteraceae bacterium]
MDKINTQIYNGEIVAGSLLIPESRHIAKLLIANADAAAWHQAIVIDNVLQKRSPAAAKRQAKLIKNRLSLMQPALWEMIDQGSNDVATQAALAAAVKHSRLLGDFMDQVIRVHWKTFITKISTTDWNSFIETCIQKDPVIDTWTDSTRAKLKQVVFRILAESKYIDGTRSLTLLPVSIVPEIKQYLVKNSEEYVLRCMNVTP